MNWKTIIAVGTMVLLTGTTNAQECFPAPDGLVAWWPGDGNTNDIQGGNTGALVNGATFASGKVGESFSVDGVDDYIEVPHSAVLNIQQAITIDVWVMKLGACTDNCWVVMKQNEADSLSCCDHLRYGLYVAGYTDNRAGFSLSLDNWTDVLTSPNPIPNNEWTHIAGTFDGSIAKLYVNGVLSNSQAQEGVITSTTQGPLYIGATRHGYDEFFNGQIDEVEIFDRALSDGEIFAIYEAGSAGKCKAETLTCAGFSPPMENYPVAVKKNRVLPLKAEVLNADGSLMTDRDIDAQPIVQIWFESGDGGVAIDETVDALSVGQGDEGNQFVFTDEGRWQFNLSTKPYTSPGTYTVLMASGDDSEYLLKPTCMTEFVIN